jgi:hypothetical protein
VQPTVPSAPTAPPPTAAEPLISPSQLALGSVAAPTGPVAVRSQGAYLDSAIIASQLRSRYDAAYNNVRPDRAEYFYAACGCNGPQFPGPPRPETSVDYLDFRTYVEFAASERVSGFVEVPVRELNPEVNDNERGLGDMNAGVKLGIHQCGDMFTTFQFRIYFPTGDANRGLGNDHVSLEPALLYYNQLGDLALEAEFRWWIPIDGTDGFAGDVLQYGIGVSYLGCNMGCFSIRPVAEFVGWTVLNGQSTVVHSLNPLSVTLDDAEGDTIVNAKLGVRMGTDMWDVYAGYGRALTGHTWYDDVVRVEFRLFY